MATKLDAYTFNGSGRKAVGSKYDQYLDGCVWSLALGKDCPPDATQSSVTIRNVAKHRGLKVRVNVDGDSLIIQAYKPTESGRDGT